MNLAQIIDKSSFLSRLYPTEKADIISASEKVEIPAGRTIYVQDAQGEFVYFLSSGEVDVFTDNDHKIKGPGDSFGEEVYFGSGKYLTTAIAKTDCEIYMVPKVSFKEIENNTKNLPEGFFSSFSQLISKEEIIKETAKKTESAQSTSLNETFGWFFTVIAPLVMFKILAMAGISPESRWFLTFLTCSVSMWMFRLFPEFVPGVFLVMSTLMFGLAPPSVVLSGLSSETFLLIMSVYVISLLVTTSGLTHRATIYLMKFASNSMLGLNLVIFFIGTILTPMVPSIISRCLLITPLVSKMLHNFRVSNKSLLSVQFAASIFYGCSIFANVILSSSLMNFVVLGLLPTQEQDQFQWFGWLKAASVYGVVIAIGYFTFMLITMMFTEKNYPHATPLLSNRRLWENSDAKKLSAFWGLFLSPLGW
ncbi:cyclic nucleotide-binding domain-containing protein [Candidatus Odyssella thessalonicensis]|uniref:cyclic nucleotide-binding domain-containing protein n=1 Tax=Candidatus Odyssella thessalonicensis TaxID=84647 RepID=UPI000305CB7C|nr:cyclic nucleotide-binding domain-containing protein [Candidatus Odyssella thessalonicensis]